VEEKVQPTAFFFFFLRGERRFENQGKEEEEEEEGSRRFIQTRAKLGKVATERDDNRHNKKNNAEEFGFYLTTRDHIARS
jgi:hypothetical protein